jgi:Phage integrase family
VDGSFPTITPHDRRHTAVSLAASVGANVKAVQRMVGHAKASMTLDTYADLFDEDLDAVADRLNAAIESTADGLPRAKHLQYIELRNVLELRGFEALAATVASC